MASEHATRAMAAYVRELDQRLPEGFDPALTEVAPHDEVTPPHGDFLLVTGLNDDAVIACGAVRLLDPDTAELRRMWVDPERRRQGFGRHLLQALETRALALGARRAVMSLAPEMVEGRRLAESQGYRPIEPFRAATTSVFLGKEL